MNITRINGVFCVELDTGSVFSEYINRIESFDDTLG